MNLRSILSNNKIEGSFRDTEFTSSTLYPKPAKSQDSTGKKKIKDKSKISEWAKSICKEKEQYMSFGKVIVQLNINSMY